MKPILLIFSIFFITSCDIVSSDSNTNSSEPFDYREYAMGSFNINVSSSYSFINPNISSYNEISKLNLSVYRSSYYDDELIIRGLRGQCAYAYMSGNNFNFSSVETNLRPENFGFNITPPCPSCKIYMSGSGSVTDNLGRRLDKSTFQITVSFNYDGLDLVSYSGSKEVDLPRPVMVREEC